jgi:hypothetical protein
MKTKSRVPPDYAAFLTELKGRIVSARLHAAEAGRPYGRPSSIPFFLKDLVYSFAYEVRRPDGFA